MQDELDKKEEKYKKRRRKFLFFWFFFLTIFLSTVTYAWFTANRIVDLQFFDIHVETDTGLEISENAIDWKSALTVDELKNAYKTYPSSLNQIPGDMNPMSSGGILDTNGYLNIFYGQVSNDSGIGYYLTTYREIEQRTTEVSNKGNFIVFDVFVRTSSPRTLYLSGNSYVGPKDGESVGIENSSRIAFIKEGNVPIDSNITRAQTTKTTDEDNVYIWEPNYDVHTEHGIRNALNTYGITTTNTNADIIPYDGVIGTVSSSSMIGLSRANSTDHPSLFKKVDVDIYTKSTNEQNRELFYIEAGITKIRIYMWLEGQDVDSENKASHGDIRYFLQFTLNP